MRPRQLGHVPPARHVLGVRQELNHVLGEDLRIDKRQCQRNTNRQFKYPILRRKSDTGLS